MRAASGLARPSVSIGLAPWAMSSARVLAQGDRADVDAPRGAESELGERRVVAERVAGGIGGLVEQQEEAVGPVDLAAAMADEERAAAAVVLGPDLGGARVAEALDHTSAVHHVGEEEGTHGCAKRTPWTRGARRARRTGDASPLEPSGPVLQGRDQRRVPEHPLGHDPLQQVVEDDARPRRVGGRG